MRTATLSLAGARKVAQDYEQIATMIGIPYEEWHARCHEISLKILRTGKFGPGRIARGTAAVILGQHSWIVLGEDVYAPQAVIVDPTLRLWLDHRKVTPEEDLPPHIYVCRAAYTSHQPHGTGSIWEHNRPEEASFNDIIELTPSVPLSPTASSFVQACLGPLGRKGWSQLANGPMQEWPAGEVIAAMDDTEALRALVPIDILGMLTDRNPGGLYR